MVAQFLHSDPLVKLCYNFGTIDILDQFFSLVLGERSIHSRISAVSEQIGDTAVDQSIEHIIFIVADFLHQPGDDQTVMEYQVEKRYRNTVFRCTRGFEHEVVGSVMAEYQARHTPVVCLF